MNLLGLISRRLWPTLDGLPSRDRLQLQIELTGVLASIPLGLAGVTWLALQTDLAVLTGKWQVLLLFLAFSLVLARLSFFQVVGSQAGNYSFNSSNLTSVVFTSAVLLFGPSAVWLYLAHTLLDYASNWPRIPAPLQRWNWARNLAFNLSSGTVALLLGLALYHRLGGIFPLNQLDAAFLGPAALAILAMILANSLFFWALTRVWVILGLVFKRGTGQAASPLVRQTLLFFMMAEAPAFFAILVAAIYSQLGWRGFLFIMGGALVGSLVARRMSQAALRSRQRSQEMAQLEHLGRALIAAPTDASALPQILAEHLPHMFQYRQAEIRLASGQILLQLPGDRQALSDQAWSWLLEQDSATLLKPGDREPWSGRPLTVSLSAVPIHANQTGKTMGSICLLFEGPLQASDMLPAMQTLAAQISSALQGAETYAQTLAFERLTQELAFARRVQASFLPTSLPTLPGWQLTAALEPARETSGDFYDAFPLPNGRLALLVGDVADKGVGAALYMALTRTLLRTYALEYHDRPDFVLRVANRRILADAQAGLFISVFYAVVDPFSHHITYCNAGHNPAFLVARRHDTPLQPLAPTGMVLGVMEGVNWEQATVTMAAGDTLVLYSDGLTDAQNEEEEFFGEEQLRQVISAHRQTTAAGLQEAVLAAAHEFTGNAPRFDDLTLMVLQRE